jgi:hypothetical protein
MATRTMAAAGELPKDARNALEAIADFERLIDLCDDQARLWNLAREAIDIVVKTLPAGPGGLSLKRIPRHQRLVWNAIVVVYTACFR